MQKFISIRRSNVKRVSNDSIITEVLKGLKHNLIYIMGRYNPRNKINTFEISV